MLPNLIIIGAQKCGTTSLHYYLFRHPQICMSKEKELDFFIEEANWRKGIGWYCQHFRSATKVRGESSPNYTCFPFLRGVAARMYSLVPDAKLIYLVRNPVERMISHYVHDYANGRENRGVVEALTEPGMNPYLARSCYYMQLKQYLEYYPAAKILILTQEELLRQRREAMRKVYRFLGVDEEFYLPEFSKLHHVSARKRRKSRAGALLLRARVMGLISRLPPFVRWRFISALVLPFSRRIERPELPENIRQGIIARFRDDLDQLSEHTGCAFADWRR